MAKTRNTSAPQQKPSGSKAEEIGNSLENNGLNGNCGNGKVRCKSLVIDGTKYRTRLNKKFENRRPWESPDPRKIVSNIPGTVVKINIKEGQEVSEGEQMLVLEAMKMKSRILFHMGGTVKSIHVKEGEKIRKNILMVELI